MIQDNISNATIGKMRMQFWKDAVKAIGTGNPPRHPIAQALYQASLQANLPTYHFKRIIDARVRLAPSFWRSFVESASAGCRATSTSPPYCWFTDSSFRINLFKSTIPFVVATFVTVLHSISCRISSWSCTNFYNPYSCATFSCKK